VFQSTGHERSATLHRVTIPAVFVNAKEQRALAPGEVLFRAGEPGSHMYGVVDGVVELRRDEHVIATVGPGDTFGELAIIDDGLRSLTAVAAEPSTVVAIDERTFTYLVHETPLFALQVMRSIAARLREVDRYA
jgi:CRP/FNR family transcriptional regulator, cyclic AMP receptor protein